MPRLDDVTDEKKREAIERALKYMGLQGGEKISDIAIDRVFIGSCTNARIEDLRAAAKMIDRKKINANVSAMVVPGSGLVKEQAEAEGLDKSSRGRLRWREPGCSMCLAMNPDKLNPGERCASTSNRNFEGRQGYKGRTHLVSPAMAAAAAVAGHFVDVREWRSSLSPHPPAAVLSIQHRAARPILRFQPIDAAAVKQRPRGYDDIGMRPVNRRPMGPAARTFCAHAGAHGTAPRSDNAARPAINLSKLVGIASSLPSSGFPRKAYTISCVVKCSIYRRNRDSRFRSAAACGAGECSSGKFQMHGKISLRPRIMMLKATIMRSSASSAVPPPPHVERG